LSIALKRKERNGMKEPGSVLACLALKPDCTLLICIS
jgi:hypothetical protein